MFPLLTANNIYLIFILNFQTNDKVKRYIV